MSQNNLIALAIFIGFTVVAGAFYMSSNKAAVAIVGSDSGGELTVKREGANAWTYGNKKAETFIIEFSDYECPFCAKVHPTIKQIVDESNGQIAWQYRHLPLPSHSNAEEAAKVSECVGRIKGNDAFWQFSDAVFAEQKSINSEKLKALAESQGLSGDELNECLASEEVERQVVIDQMTARALGGSGTPYSVILRSDGSVTPVTGALPYDNWLQLLSQ